MGEQSGARRWLQGLLLARRGFGPLLQRDYWGVLLDPQLTPREVAELVAERFETFAPHEVARFTRRVPTGVPLAQGDELEVHIPLTGRFGVRVLHRNPQSLTIGTLEGHPEAGRITFGAYRNDAGRVVFHIRSRARSRSRLFYAGFLTAGDPMQTRCWTGFVNGVGLAAGHGIDGVVHALTTRLRADEGDLRVHGPTFLARGN